MGTLGRGVTGALFVLFLGAVALRPLRANPGVAAAFDGGLLTWPTVLWLPVLAVSLLVVGVRLRQAVDDESSTEPSNPGTDTASDSEWGVAEEWGNETGADETVGWDDENEASEAVGWDDERGSSDEGESAGEDESDPGDVASIPERPAALTADPQRPTTPIRQRPKYRMLADTADVEQQPPDAPLRAHLEHLRAELDGDDLEQLEQVVAETDEKSPIPDRCPQAHCSARWEERSVLGINTGRYEVIDGERICCLECESVVPIEDAKAND